MKKENDTIKVSSESKLQLPLANLIGIILVVSGAVMGWANLTGRITSLETARQIMETDLISKSDQKITDQEQYLLLEILSTSQETTDAEMHSMRNNTVELNRAMKDIEEMKRIIEELKDKVRANGNGQSH